VIYDGHGQDDPEFAREVADSLGAFATANQWSVDNLTKQLEQRIFWLNNCIMICNRWK
jgi:hypothetical protein